MGIYWDNIIDEDSLTMGVVASNHNLVAEFSSTTTNALIKIFPNTLDTLPTINGYTIGTSNHDNVNQSFKIGQIMNGNNYPIVSANNFTIYNHKVGINNPYPQYTLDVNGNGNFSSNLFVQGPSFVIPVGSTNARPIVPTQGTIRYNTDTNNFEGYGSKWGSLGGGIDGGGVINTAQTTYIKAELYPNANDNNLRFVNSNIETMRINSNGLVGIGTSNPQYNLDVVGNVYVSSNLIVNTRILGSPNNALIIGSQTSTSTIIDGSLQIIGNAHVLGTITAAKIRLGAPGAVTNILGITSLENVSINNLTCIQPINGTINGSITSAQISDINPYITNIVTNTSSTNSSNILLTDTNTMPNGQNGYITFSKSSDTFNKLYTNKNKLYYNASSNTINANLIGNVSSIADSNIQINKQSITGASNIISKLNGYTYSYIDNNNIITGCGLNAQEVKKQLPQVVKQNLENILTIEYGNMAGLWVEAFNEMYRRIAILESAVSSMQSSAPL